MYLLYLDVVSSSQQLGAICRQAEGSLPGPHITAEDLQAVHQPVQAACLLFVVNSPAMGLLAGESTFDVAQLATLTSSIQAAMLKVCTCVYHITLHSNLTSFKLFA